MAYKNIKNIEEYDKTIYSGDSKHKLKIWFNDVELEDADYYCEKVTIKSRIIPNTEERFSLSNLVSKSVEITLHDIEVDKIVDQVKISLGTLVNNEYEYVPMGIFNIQDKPKSDNGTITITLNDNAVKLDYNYSAEQLMIANNGSATKLQIFKDICETFGITTKVEHFLHDDNLIGVFDNTIKGRTYIAYLAEQAGCIATFDRDGDLIFVDINKEESTEVKSQNNDIYIDDGVERKIEDIKVYGNIEQDSTPTPENPQEIKGLKGKNLFNFSNWYNNKSDIYMTNGNIEINNNSIIISNPTSIDAFTRGTFHMYGSPSEKDKNIVKTFGVKVKQNTTYTLSFFNENQCKSEIYVFLYDKNCKYLKLNNRSVNTNEINFCTFTTDANTEYMSFRLDNEGYGSNITTLKATNIQLEEGSSATDYLPYNTIEVKAQNKNLLYTPYTEDNKLTDTSTKDDYAKMTDYYAELEAGETYFISYKTDGVNGHDNTENKVELYLALDKRYEQAIKTDTVPQKFTPKVSGKYYLRYDINKNGETHSFWDFQIEKGSSSDTYIEHQEQSYLLSLGNIELYKDEYIYKDNDKWYLHKVFKLENPIDEEITDETLINQLEDIKNMSMYDDITNISLNASLDGELDLTYAKKKEPIEIPLDIVESYKNGDEYEVSKVVYEDAIRRFEKINENKDKDFLYIDSANPYISNQEQINDIYDKVNGFKINSFNTGKILGNPRIDPYDIIKILDGEQEFKTLATNTLTYNGVLISTFDTQIGKEEKKQNVFVNSEPAKFKRAFTEIDNIKADVRIVTEQTQTIQSDLQENYYEKTSINELIQNAEKGVTNTFSEAGGNNIFRNTGLWFEQSDSANPYEFWKGIVTRNRNDKSSNGNSLLLQKATLEQEQDVSNGKYSVSFKYKLLNTLANVKVVINDKEYALKSTEDTEFFTGNKNAETNEYIVEPVIVAARHINVKFISDTNNSCEIYDLMVNAGEVRLAYSQNQNEVTTNTVNISKGITITSSDTDTTFKADSDGIRTLDKSGNVKTKFTDTGMITTKQEVTEEANIVKVLVQDVNEQTWFTRI